MRGREELNKHSEVVLYGIGVTREETAQYKQVEVILFAFGQVCKQK